MAVQKRYFEEGPSCVTTPLFKSGVQISGGMHLLYFLNGCSSCVSYLYSHKMFHKNKSADKMEANQQILSYQVWQPAQKLFVLPGLEWIWHGWHGDCLLMSHKDPPGYSVTVLLHALGEHQGLLGHHGKHYANDIHKMLCKSTTCSWYSSAG